MNGPYRDGRIHVLNAKCSSCVFRPGNLMNLEPGRVKGMVDAANADQSAITCHQTLPYGAYDAEPAVCRGFYDAHQTEPLTLATRLGLVEFDEQPTKVGMR